jgi:hypothetical protein
MSPVPGGSRSLSVDSIVELMMWSMVSMLLPHSLSFLFACCRAVAEVMAVSASPTFNVFEFFYSGRQC